MNTNELRNYLVNTAKSYLGAAKGSAGHLDIVKTYNGIRPLPQGYTLKTSDAWCAATVSAMAAKCGMLGIIPAECSCPRQVGLWQKLGRWKEDDAYVPQAGDVIYYDWKDSGAGDNKGAPGHVGIVVGVSGSTITVIEGNKGSPAQVGYRYIAVNGRYIRGYGLPNFAALATEKAATTAPKTTVQAAVKVVKTSAPAVSSKLPELRAGSRGDYVGVLQNFLLALGYTSLGSADRDFGAKTKKAVTRFQEKHNLIPDGIVGALTWAAILKALPNIKRGVSAYAVKGLQLYLIANGYSVGKSGVDGDFGANTKSAVKKFQAAHRLDPDGEVGPLTKNVM